MTRYVKLSCRENQAAGIGQYAIDFLAGRLGHPAQAVLAKVEQFHLDSVGCGVAALDATGASSSVAEARKGITRISLLPLLSQALYCCSGATKS